MHQSGRAGDKAKKRKSPAKSGRVGITRVGACNGMRGGAEGHISHLMHPAPCTSYLILSLKLELSYGVLFSAEFTFDRALSHNLLCWYWQENSQERRV